MMAKENRTAVQSDLKGIKTQKEAVELLTGGRAAKDKGEAEGKQGEWFSYCFQARCTAFHAMKEYCLW